MSFEVIPGGKKSVHEEYQESHAQAKQHLGAAYSESKVDAIAGVRGWGVVLAELSSLSKESDPAAWYEEKENAECLEMFGK